MRNASSEAAAYAAKKKALLENAARLKEERKRGMLCLWCTSLIIHVLIVCFVLCIREVPNVNMYIRRRSKKRGGGR